MILIILYYYDGNFPEFPDDDIILTFPIFYNDTEDASVVIQKSNRLPSGIVFF